MPDYTRLYYRKGKTEIIVQEFPPQTRLMKFKGALCKRDNSSSKLDKNVMDQTFNYSLSLPYVIFIFKFVDGVYSTVCCAFSDRPLKKLEETPFKPYLSNLDSNLKVCLGKAFNKDKLVRNDLVQQCSFILDHFWHSVYSDEWSHHFWDSKNHFSDDDRMKSVEAWEEASEDNPLFVVEDVDWPKYKEENFGDMIVRLIEGDKDNSSLQLEIFDEITNEFLDEVKDTLEGNLDRVEERLNTNAEKLIAKDLTEILEQQGS
jgi:hypothetical protein